MTSRPMTSRGRCDERAEARFFLFFYSFLYLFIFGCFTGRLRRNCQILTRPNLGMNMLYINRACIYFVLFIYTQKKRVQKPKHKKPASQSFTKSQRLMLAATRLDMIALR